jgi:hypothetical protein
MWNWKAVLSNPAAKLDGKLRVSLGQGAIR